MDILKIAQETLKTEINGLTSLKKILDENFATICEKVANCKGRVILSGVGKSGHIGKKISSTMSSIGIPSFFLHPSEASHGDLGMICQEDLVIMISNSGETKEFTYLISFVKNEKIASVAITRSEFSTLANATDYKIVMPQEPEALSYGAPTTSTTQTLAVGDIIAVCASNLKHFSENDYGRIHPGGKLGLSLMKIENVMRKKEETSIFQIKSDLKSVISNMKAGFAIIANSKNILYGVLTDGDIRRGILKFENIGNVALKEIVTTHPKYLKSSDSLIKAIEMFNEFQIGTIAIVNDNNEVVGSLDRKDISF